MGKTNGVPRCESRGRPVGQRDLLHSAGADAVRLTKAMAELDKSGEP
ncbi:MAG: hypothetical protein ABFD82_03860 [Syntrophaceae bacterium]